MSAIARARAFDSEGRHDAAINELANAAQRGDAEAMTQLAKRIIVGDRAPRLRRQGIGLLGDAVKMGSAEAADRLAVIRATFRLSRKVGIFINACIPSKRPARGSSACASLQLPP